MQPTCNNRKSNTGYKKDFSEHEQSFAQIAYISMVRYVRKSVQWSRAFRYILIMLALIWRLGRKKEQKCIKLCINEVVECHVSCVFAVMGN